MFQTLKIQKVELETRQRPDKPSIDALNGQSDQRCFAYHSHCPIFPITPSKNMSSFQSYSLKWFKCSLSTSSTPITSSFRRMGMTTSDFDAELQAMWPLKVLTSCTTIARFSCQAVPQTPFPLKILVQAGGPWNSPKVRNSFPLVLYTQQNPIHHHLNSSFSMLSKLDVLASGWEVGSSLAQNSYLTRWQRCDLVPLISGMQSLDSCSSLISNDSIISTSSPENKQYDPNMIPW